MLRPTLAALALVASAALAGCGSASRHEAHGPAPSQSVQAFPDLPHVTGPLPVELRPALVQVGDGGCRPEPEQQVCLRDGSGYRVLGTTRRARSRT